MPVNNFQFVSKIFLLRFARRQMTLSAKISNFKASLDVVLVFEAAVKRGGDTTSWCRGLELVWEHQGLYRR